MEQGFSTKIIHSVYSKRDAHNALQMPIYSNAAFEFETAEGMEQAFQGRLPDHMYSRISNPTVENFEQRVKAVTGAIAVTALSSGMAAISNVFLTIAQNGDNIIASKHLFGNTYSLFTSTLKSFGIETRFCDLTKPEEVIRQIDNKSVAIFFETITNPQLEVVNIAALSEVAKLHHLVLIADSTLTPFHIFKAKQHHVDLEVVSGTKIISGGATSVGGLIIDYGTYQWSSNPKLTSYAKRFGPFAFNAKLRKEVFRNLGACLSPYHAYLQSLGLETLTLRFKKSGENCLRIAEFLQTQKKTVIQVNYPGLPGSPFYNDALHQFGRYPGAMLTFQLATKELCFQFLNRLEIISKATNIYDNKSLILHPASTIFCDFTPETRQDLGISDTLLRLSVGIEDFEDIKQDIEQALELTH